MKAENAAVAVQSIATGAAAAFGLTWWSLVAALIGAAAGLHFEKDEAPREFFRTVLVILVMAVLGAAVGGTASFVLPHLWGGFAEVPQPLWALLAGIFSRPIHARLKREASERRAPGG